MRERWCNSSIFAGAGLARWTCPVLAGRENCNDFSIGIELEGTDEIPYTDVQYHVLQAVTLALLQAYPNLGSDRIAGHSEISPGRKTDPGPAFDWQRYRDGLATVTDKELPA